MKYYIVVVIGLVVAAYLTGVAMGIVIGSSIL